MGQTIQLLKDPVLSAAQLVDQIRQAPASRMVLDQLRNVAPDLGTIPQLTYTLYRQFEHSGARGGYERPYFLKRSQLSRAVMEMILAEGGGEEYQSRVEDLLWSICEETSWVLPAHEEQGPDYWELHPSPRQTPLGAHSALTREPDAIDLFAAETGASLAEAIFLIGDRIAPEVRQRVRQEVERRIFKPYLAYGRDHWWHRGALNWNGVCNGSIGLAFLRLERDAATLSQAMEQVLEGFEAYIATGFEEDGGSIEGPGYWNYGLMYYVALAELLYEQTGGALDLLAQPRLRDIARYPIGMALAPGRFINFGDASESLALEPGIVQRLAMRIRMPELGALPLTPDQWPGHAISPARLAIVVRDALWWDGQSRPFPSEAREDFFLPACGVIKLNGTARSGKHVVLAAKAGHNDGHHSHADIGSLIVHVGGESLLCDPGGGLYSREYFRHHRYANIFCNSYGHSVPRIAGCLQEPGPEFGGRQQFRGEIVSGETGAQEKRVEIEFASAYEVPGLNGLLRQLKITPDGGEITLVDSFKFSDTVLAVEEAFVTWANVAVDGQAAVISGERAAIELRIEEPAGAVFTAARLEEDCRANKKEKTLTRIAAALPDGTVRFQMRISPR